MEPMTQSRGNAARIRTGVSNAIVAGSHILTQEGEIPVEFVSSGDRIITRDRGLCVLRDVRIHKVVAKTITIAAGSLSHSCPDRDATVLATQQILIRDWRAAVLHANKTAMVEADKLVDGRFVCDNGEQQVTLVELVFDAPHVVYADGLELACDAVEMAQAA